MKRSRVTVGGLLLCALIGFSWAAAPHVRAAGPSIRIDPASKASERGRRLLYSANSSNFLRAAGEPQLDPALPGLHSAQYSRGVEGATRAPAIDRTVGLIRLGMTVEEFQKTVQSSEQTGMNPGLIEDERSFEIARDSLAPEIRVMGCRFLHGRLYRITVEYRENSFDQARWDERVNKNMERYGKVPVQSQRLGERPVEFIQWDDPNTRLLLQREHRMGFESKQVVKKFSVSMILMDLALWNERQEAEGSLF